ncbi:Alpha/beta hydrolase fold-3 [Cadophora sp. DSE1049]|nr:Alpha/beta hydrolase fold-3 [Cadophora sp. DSE1049]
MHGGALVLGNRYFFLGSTFPIAKELDAVVISVEYRLAPEFAAPAQVEDCYAGLEWIFQNASKLGIDPERIIVGGSSAGGGLAAGVALLARDRKGPPIFALKLTYPMLDDCCASISMKQYMNDGWYDGTQNIAAWNMVLPGTRGSKDVSIYVAPSRAEDLSDLPPTCISVGAGDPFRDEDVAFASKLWECGVNAELHVWPGAWHGFDVLAPTAEISIAAVKAEMEWLKRILK